ncbi:troponin T, skeletal muscle-like [Gossypium australe]|uniref:Troponin T, skeletal muscle-like n=1 Tax=Gossypium australe TaxID=47621 RepID=A0A5B6WFT2_9ROSI|nr:troponin T, skeletal muscle-like [Gossypium australe]
MMGDIKRQIGTGIPSNTKDNPLRKGKENMKATALRSGSLLSSPKIPTPEVTMDNTDKLEDNSLEDGNEPEPEEENTPATETGKETPKDDKITKVLKYAKFLKEMMARRKKINVEQVDLSASCSVIISR